MTDGEWANAEQQIIDCWERNTDAWSKAIRKGEISSRVQVTDQAVIDAVEACQPDTVLDIGCGEGWLTEVLTQTGRRVCGVDAIPGFIEQASLRRQGQFLCGDYSLLTRLPLAQAFQGAAIDLLVCNFSLIGKDSTEAVFEQAAELLQGSGFLVVQTLHPDSVDMPGNEGWRAGSWSGFSEDFIDPAPWFFRSMESWRQLFREAGCRKIEICEPVHVRTGQPCSVIFTGRF